MFKSTIRKNIISQNWADFRANLAIAISKRKISRKQIQKLYSLLRESKEGQFYADNQSTYPINTNVADWNTEYLDELFAAVVNGYTNEKIVLHMCDVSNKLKWSDRRFILKFFIAILTAIVGIVLAVLCILHCGKDFSNESLCNKQEYAVTTLETAISLQCENALNCTNEYTENSV